MTLWEVVLLASLACLALKVAGYLVPSEFLERERPSRVATLLTVALLAGLVVVQGLTVGTDLVIDARVPALLVAAVLLALRAPFLVVIVAAALTAALLRAIWGG